MTLFETIPEGPLVLVGSWLRAVDLYAWTVAARALGGTLPLHSSRLVDRLVLAATEALILGIPGAAARVAARTATKRGSALAAALPALLQLKLLEWDETAALVADSPASAPNGRQLNLFWVSHAWLERFRKAHEACRSDLAEWTNSSSAKRGNKRASGGSDGRRRSSGGRGSTTAGTGTYARSQQDIRADNDVNFELLCPHGKLRPLKVGGGGGSGKNSPRAARRAVSRAAWMALLRAHPNSTAFPVAGHGCALNSSSSNAHASHIDATDEGSLEAETKAEPGAFGECEACARDAAQGRATAAADASAALAARDAYVAALPLPLRRLLSRRSNHSGGCPSHLLRSQERSSCHQQGTNMGSSSSSSSSGGGGHSNSSLFGNSAVGSGSGGGHRLGTAAEAAAAEQLALEFASASIKEQADADLAFALSLQEAEFAGGGVAAAGGGPSGLEGGTSVPSFGSAKRGCPLQPGLYYILPHAWLREWRRSLRDPVKKGSNRTLPPLPPPNLLRCAAHDAPMVPQHMLNWLAGRAPSSRAVKETAEEPSSNSSSSSSSGSSSSGGPLRGLGEDEREAQELVEVLSEDELSALAALYSGPMPSKHAESYGGASSPCHETLWSLEVGASSSGNRFTPKKGRPLPTNDEAGSGAYAPESLASLGQFSALAFACHPPFDNCSSSSNYSTEWREPPCQLCDAGHKHLENVVMARVNRRSSSE